MTQEANLREIGPDNCAYWKIAPAQINVHMIFNYKISAQRETLEARRSCNTKSTDDEFREMSYEGKTV